MFQTLPCRVKICEPSLVLTLMHWVRGHSLVSPWLDARWNAATTDQDQDRNQLWDKKVFRKPLSIGTRCSAGDKPWLDAGTDQPNRDQNQLRRQKMSWSSFILCECLFWSQRSIGKILATSDHQVSSGGSKIKLHSEKILHGSCLNFGTKEKYLFKVCYHLCYFVKDIFFALVCSKKAWLLVCFLANEIIGYLAELKGLCHLCMPAMPSVATFLATLRYFGCHPPVLLKRQCVQSTNIWHNYIHNPLSSQAKQKASAVYASVHLTQSPAQWSSATTKQPIWPK